MTWMFVLLIVLYGAFGFFWTTRLMIHACYRSHPRAFGWDDVFFSAVLGLFIGSWGWPAWMLAWAIKRFWSYDAKAFAIAVGSETPERKAERLEAENKLQKKRLKEMEQHVLEGPQGEEFVRVIEREVERQLREGR